MPETTKKSADVRGNVAEVDKQIVPSYVWFVQMTMDLWVRERWRKKWKSLVFYQTPFALVHPSPMYQMSLASFGKDISATGYLEEYVVGAAKYQAFSLYWSKRWDQFVTLSEQQGTKVEIFGGTICDKIVKNGGEQSRWRISLSLPGGRGETCGEVKTNQKWFSLVIIFPQQHLLSGIRICPLSPPHKTVFLL